MAFEIFRRAGVDTAVVEVGLGGRFDATNVITPAVTAITSIALDHERHLGATLAEIAFEKAGIIKPSIPVVVGEIPAAPRVVIAAQAAEQRRAAGRRRHSPWCASAALTARPRHDHVAHACRRIRAGAPRPERRASGGQCGGRGANARGVPRSRNRDKIAGRPRRRSRTSTGRRASNGCGRARLSCPDRRRAQSCRRAGACGLPARGRGRAAADRAGGDAGQRRRRHRACAGAGRVHRLSPRRSRRRALHARRRSRGAHLARTPSAPVVIAADAGPRDRGRAGCALARVVVAGSIFLRARSCAAHRSAARRQWPSWPF